MTRSDVEAALAARDERQRVAEAKAAQIIAQAAASDADWRRRHGFQPVLEAHAINLAQNAGAGNITPEDATQGEHE